MQPKISYSMRQMFKSCPRKVYFKYVAGIKPLRIESKALLTGRAFHLGLSTFRESKNIDMAMATMCDSFDGLETEENQIECCKLKAYLIGYLNYFDDEKKTWRAEEKIETDSTLSYIDGIIVEEDGCHLIEDKTRSVLTPRLDDTMYTNDQLMNYVFECSKAGMKIKSIEIREILKSRTRPKKKESLEAYADRVLDEYQDSKDKFQSCSFSPDFLSLLDYQKEIDYFDKYLNEWLKSQRPLAHWPRNHFSCVNVYGSCDYLDLCSGACPNRSFIRTDYEPLDGGKFLQCNREVINESYSTEA